MTTSRGPRLLAIAGVVAFVLAAGLVAASLATGKDAAAPAPAPAPGEVFDTSETDALLEGIPQRGNILGKVSAPVTLAEYADLQCPYCAHWTHTALPEIVRDYVRTGKVRIEFRGLAFIGPDSELGLRAVLAAGRQRKLWTLLDLLYHNQGHENSGWLSEQTLRDIGASVDGLDVERMLADRGSVDAQLDAAQSAATAAGINGTPAFQVGPTGGHLHPVQVSSLDADALRPALDAALGR
jgi:protein-disulfide isomerase